MLIVVLVCECGHNINKDAGFVKPADNLKLIRKAGTLQGNEFPPLLSLHINLHIEEMSRRGNIARSDYKHTFAS